MKVVVVGGGTTGWLTCAYLCATTDYEITLLESKDIPSIEVGESTSPALKGIAQEIGVSERTWMRDSLATLKYGIWFRGWAYKKHEWFHSFDEQWPDSVVGYLDGDERDSRDYNDAHGNYFRMFRQNISPFDHHNVQTSSKIPGYAYHVNAFRFGESMKNAIPKGRYTHIYDEVTSIMRDIEDGDVLGVVCKSGQIIKGDLFWDCTGFNTPFGDINPWRSYTDLYMDRACWGPVKTSPDYLIVPATTIHAQTNGWIWQTPTWGNLGSGYVWCDGFEKDSIEEYWNGQWEEYKEVKFDSGRRTAWCKNVIHNGLAQSFLEPLEATSIMVSCFTLQLFNRTKNPKVFNKVFDKFLENTKEFVRLHYALSDRTDSDFWNEVREDDAEQQMSDHIQKHLNTSRGAKTGETILTQWNWASMLMGYKKKYLNDLPKFDREDFHLQRRRRKAQNGFRLLHNQEYNSWLRELHR